MARGDGIHRTNARNARMKNADIGNAQAHNEREKSSYVNQDIVPERTPYNVHFKTPTAGYKEMFEQMRSDGVISTRGLKADAEKFGELIFDVNSAYFFNHGGYDFAKQFYADAYKAAIKIVGGEQYILSAVMHADERNRAMSDALGQDVYHYHLHVVYLPVVEKQILWSKRCKNESLRGTVKEIIQQVSMSKKWASKPALDENGDPILSTKGKPVLKKSYSVLQDDFFRYMRDAGYDDVERGERGSSEEHLTVTQFKVQREQARLAELTEQNRQQEQQAATLGKQIKKIQNQQVDVAAIEKIEAKPGRQQSCCASGCGCLGFSVTFSVAPFNVQFICHFLLHSRKQVRVPVGDFHAFVSNTIADGNGGIAHVDKKGNVAVSQVVDSDDFDTRRLAAKRHAALQGIFG